jgi:hypothetical protein
MYLTNKFILKIFSHCMNILSTYKKSNIIRSQCKMMRGKRCSAIQWAQPAFVIFNSQGETTLCSEIIPANEHYSWMLYPSSRKLTWCNLNQPIPDFLVAHGLQQWLKNFEDAVDQLLLVRLMSTNKEVLFELWWIHKIGMSINSTSFNVWRIASWAMTMNNRVFENPTIQVTIE